MAVCIPADQNETFTVSSSEEDILLREEEEDEERDSLLPLTTSSSSSSSKHVKHDFHDIDVHHEGKTVVGVVSNALLPSIPEAEDGSMELLAYDEEEEDYHHERSPDLEDDDDGHPHFQPRRFLRREEDEFVLPLYARAVEEGGHDEPGSNHSETAQLFRELLQRMPPNSDTDHTAFSNGTADSHPYLFQHFDALEYEEGASVRPKFIGHYLLGDCLGEGSYAKVKVVSGHFNM